jgi:hypothetical protein
MERQQSDGAPAKRWSAGILPAARRHLAGCRCRRAWERPPIGSQADARTANPAKGWSHLLRAARLVHGDCQDCGAPYRGSSEYRSEERPPRCILSPRRHDDSAKASDMDRRPPGQGWSHLVQRRATRAWRRPWSAPAVPAAVRGHLGRALSARGSSSDASSARRRQLPAELSSVLRRRDGCVPPPRCRRSLGTAKDVTNLGHLAARLGTATYRLARRRALGESRRHRIPAARHGAAT